MDIEAPVVAARARIAAQLVGRDRELELVLAAVDAGRDLVLEGPPGTSKTTILRAITADWGIPLLFVEGNADLTPSKLVGHHNPARVLREDYRPENFVPGPLIEAMEKGGFLYIEEFNRAPEDTLNTLLTAMGDRQLTVARVGTIEASQSFRVIASMNPIDDVGTARLSSSVLDRLCRLSIGYQDAAAEAAIVSLRIAGNAGSSSATLGAGLVDDVVAVTRATRAHRDVRQGSSVRGAIDCNLVVGRICLLRGIETAEGDDYDRALLDGMLVALSGRIHLDEASQATPEQILLEIWQEHLLLRHAAEPG